MAARTSILVVGMGVVTTLVAAGALSAPAIASSPTSLAVPAAAQSTATDLGASGSGVPVAKSDHDDDHDHEAVDPKALRGLARHPAGRCKEMYEVTAVPGLCSHGPDAPAHGWTQDVATSVPPLTTAQLAVGVLATTAGADAAIPTPAPVCVGDGSSGNRVEILYVRESGAADRYGQYLASIRAWAQGIDGIIDASAAETGASRRIRFVTDSSCQIVVTNIVVPNGSLADFGRSVDAVKAVGFGGTDRKYVMFVDATIMCGIAAISVDTRPDQANANNFGPSYGRVDSGCWGAAAATHEFTHTLGAVLQGSPHSTPYGHCTDDYDIMCYVDGPGVTVGVVCGNLLEDSRLDCNHDDYFNPNPIAGTWLATHWNTANSSFLIAGAAASPRGSQILGPGGKCVDVAGGDSGGNLARVQLWDCEGNSLDQHWTLTGGTLRSLSRCLDIDGNGTGIGTIVQLWDCNGVGGQQWVQQADGSLRNPQSGRCLDSPGGSTANGAGLRIWDCNGSGAQKFVIGSTIIGPAGKCVDVFGDDNGANLAKVELWDCLSGARDQHWTVTGGTLQSLGRCLDVDKNSTAGGTIVQLWDCTGVGGQQWVQQADGSLLNPQSGRCLDSPDGSTANGAWLRIWDCNGTAAQKFRIS